MSTENEAAEAAEKETLTGDLSPGGLVKQSGELLEDIMHACEDSGAPVRRREVAIVLRLLLVYINSHDDDCVQAVETKLENAVESLLVDVQALRDVPKLSETQRWISRYGGTLGPVAHITDQGGVWPDFTLCGIKWKGTQVARFARTPHFGEPSSLPGNGHALCRSCLLMKDAETSAGAGYAPRGCSCPDCDVCREAGCNEHDACRAGSP